MKKMIVRAGFIGDVHGGVLRLEAALRLFEAERVDAVLCSGDICDGGGGGAVDRCCELLVSVGALVTRGNHERWLLGGTMRNLTGATKQGTLSAASIAFLESLPATIELETAAGAALLCHGLGVDDMATVNADDGEYAIQYNSELQRLIRCGRYGHILAGHSHRPMVRRFGRMVVVNAGTLLEEEEPGVMLLEFASRNAIFFSLTSTTPRPLPPVRL